MQKNPYGNNSPQKITAFILAALSVLFWGITFVNTKYLSRDFSALEILVFRFLIAYIVLWIFFPHFPRVRSLKDEILFATAGWTGVTFYQFMENVAISHTAASNVSIIISTCPMLTAMASEIFLKEKCVTPRFVLGFAISIAGVVLVTTGGASIQLKARGDIIALVAAASWAFYSLVVSKTNALDYPKAFVVRRTFFWAIVFMIPLIAAGKVWGFESCAFSLDAADFLRRFKNPLNIMNIAFLGLGASAFCFWAWGKACAVLGTVKTTAGIYFNPVITIIVGALFLGERLGLAGLAGAALVLLGLVISTSGKKQNSGPNSE